MNRTYLIGLGIAVLLLVTGLWVYLFFSGGSENSPASIFTNLISITPDVVEPTAEQNNQEVPASVAPTSGPLRQLTTKPVAGFIFPDTDTLTVRYVERGTGYVYEINLTDDSEQRLSERTIPGVTEAIFSEDGVSVALTLEMADKAEVIAGIIDQDTRTIEPISLPAGAIDPNFTAPYTLRYGVTTAIGTDGYELDLIDGEPLRIFSVPLRSVALLWEDETYLYPKPTAFFPGALYLVNANLTGVTDFAYGFVGGVTATHFIGSAFDGDELISYTIDRESGKRTRLAIAFVPEKCAVPENSSDTLWCAATVDGFTSSNFELWYQGAVESSDLLWEIDLVTGEAFLVEQLAVEAGQVIDVDRLVVDNNGDAAIFRNRIDGTLWVYDTRLQ